jgi:hypothetical protein
VHCSKIAEAEAAVSFNEKKWFVMHSVHVHSLVHWDAKVSLAQGVTTAALPAGNNALQCATHHMTSSARTYVLLLKSSQQQKQTGVSGILL